MAQRPPVCGERKSYYLQLPKRTMIIKGIQDIAINTAILAVQYTIKHDPGIWMRADGTGEPPYTGVDVAIINVENIEGLVFDVVFGKFPEQQQYNGIIDLLNAQMDYIYYNNQSLYDIVTEEVLNKATI